MGFEKIERDILNIGIDFDQTILESKNSIEFFSTLTHLLCQEHNVYIISDAELGTEQLIAEELDDLEIDYSEIVITDTKAQFIKENSITIFFEDTDDYFLELGPEVLVFKVRGETNFNYSAKKWVMSKNNILVHD
jgi:hypothetical protein